MRYLKLQYKENLLGMLQVRLLHPIQKKIIYFWTAKFGWGSSTCCTAPLKLSRSKHFTSIRMVCNKLFLISTTLSRNNILYIIQKLHMKQAFNEHICHESLCDQTPESSFINLTDTQISTISKGNIGHIFIFKFLSLYSTSSLPILRRRRDIRQN